MFTSRSVVGRRGPSVLSTLLLALWLPLCAQAQTAAPPASTLTLEQAIQLSQRHSRQMAAQDAVAQAARQMAVAAGQLPDLVLKLGVNNLPVSGPDQFNLTSDFMTMQSVGVMRELVRADKRQARTARFEREAEVADANRDLVQANLQRDTATAWLERHYLERLIDLLSAQRTEAALQVEAAEATYRGGRGTQADVFATRSAVALIDERIQQTQIQVLTAQTRLVRWVGPEGRLALAPPPDLATVPMNALNLEDYLQAQPQAVVMARQEAAARADADVAQSEKKPDWTVELMFNQRGPAFSNMASLNFAVPLQLNQGKRQDRELRAKLALVEQMQARREEDQWERVAQVRSWLQQWQGNRERLLTYDRTLLPLSQQRTQAALTAYRGNSNGGSLTTVLEARRMETDTRIDRLRLEMETAGLWAQLNYLIASGHSASSLTALATARGE